MTKSLSINKKVSRLCNAALASQMNTDGIQLYAISCCRLDVFALDG